MAVHRQPAEAGTDPLGPRFRTLVPVEASGSDVQPRTPISGPHRDWRVAAWDYWESSRAAIEEWRDRSHAQARRQALNANPEPGETEQFARWVARAIEAGNARAQIDIIDSIPVPPIWLRRYQQALREALAADEQPLSAPADQRIDDPSRPALAGTTEHACWWEAGAAVVREGFDTGTLWYEPPLRTREV